MIQQPGGSGAIKMTEQQQIPTCQRDAQRETLCAVQGSIEGAQTVQYSGTLTYSKILILSYQYPLSKAQTLEMLLYRDILHLHFIIIDNSMTMLTYKTIDKIDIVSIQLYVISVIHLL